ncbi:SGNH/GDSL hydrolase family protein [uncultured Williamsia sp.]|uniref:SGNH/GDSL hydrolase family protein n=1 Tax=uncultured Williamsia sp. TaxID=259311 RepID=UPI002610EE78|nr:SGNH/GDSL hydrolase family protein [uncultured Williamsia sp.]
MRTPRRATARRRSSAAVLLAVIAVLVGHLTAASATPLPDPSGEASAPATSAVHYVALGDSRAAGLTTTSQAGGDGCGRTDAGYPELVARALGVASFTTVACGGAVAADVVDRGQSTSNGRRVPVQTAVLRPDTTLVTLSVGGNDIRWFGIVDHCMEATPGRDRDCRADPALPGLIAGRLATLSTRLDHVLAGVRAHAPSARLLVVGHGGYFGPRGCPGEAPFSDADAPVVAGFFRQLDGVYLAAAERAGAGFVDVGAAAVGHDSCAAPGQRWFTGVRPAEGVPSTHPTPAGSEGIAKAVVATLALSLT